MWSSDSVAQSVFKNKVSSIPWACKWVHSLWKTVWKFIKKLKIELLYDIAIPYLIFIQRKQNKYLEKICTPMFTTPLFIVTKTWEQHKYPLMDKWMKKM